MKKSFLMIIWLVLLIFMSVTSPVFADVPNDKLGKDDEWRQRMELKKQELFKTLNLTDEQKKLLDENKNKNRERLGALYKSMGIYKEQMRLELQNETLNMGKINQLQSQIKQIQGNILDQRLEGILEVHKILSPEQFKKFSEHMQRQHNNFRKRMHGDVDRFSKGPHGEAEEKSPPNSPEIP